MADRRSQKPGDEVDSMANEITQSLHRINKTMQEEIDKSIQSYQILGRLNAVGNWQLNIDVEKSIRKIGKTKEKYDEFGGVIGRTSGALKDLWRREKSDQFWIGLSLLIFLLAVLHVILARLWVPPLWIVTVPLQWTAQKAYQGYAKVQEQWQPPSFEPAQTSELYIASVVPVSAAVEKLNDVIGKEVPTTKTLDTVIVERKPTLSLEDRSVTQATAEVQQSSKDRVILEATLTESTVTQVTAEIIVAEPSSTKNEMSLHANVKEPHSSETGLSADTTKEPPSAKIPPIADSTGEKAVASVTAAEDLVELSSENQVVQEVSPLTITAEKVTTQASRMAETSDTYKTESATHSFSSVLDSELVIIEATSIASSSSQTTEGAYNEAVQENSTFEILAKPASGTDTTRPSIDIAEAVVDERAVTIEPSVTETSSHTTVTRLREAFEKFRPERATEHLDHSLPEAFETEASQDDIDDATFSDAAPSSMNWESSVSTLNPEFSVEEEASVEPIVDKLADVIEAIEKPQEQEELPSINNDALTNTEKGKHNPYSEDDATLNEEAVQSFSPLMPQKAIDNFDNSGNRKLEIPPERTDPKNEKIDNRDHEDL